MSTQIQCKKKCQHKKSMWNIYLYIYIVYSEYFSTYFSRRWHKFLYPEFEWSQWEVSLPTDPSFYTCFHDAHLSLIVSYQFNLLNYVHYLFVCFLNIFMSKEIHKNESRLRLLQKKKNYLSNQTVYLWQRRKLHFHYFALLDILNCLLSNIRF